MAAIACMAIARAGSDVLLARQNPTLQGHPDDYPRADIEYGARLYTEQCFACHGGNGDGVAGVDLRSGKFRNAVTDPQLRTVITNGFPNAGMPAFTFDPSELTGLVAYLRNMNTVDRGSLNAGNAAPGQVVFEGKGACLSCHRVNNVGSRKAPDLSDIGAIRSAGSLERSLRNPSSQMMPINRPVHIVTRDGKVINGRRLNEDTYTVQIADEEGRLMSLAKADLREFRISNTSTMPSYEKELSSQELADVVSYLLSLKGR
jgi:putative heme-binding domain-containing protein